MSQITAQMINFGAQFWWPSKPLIFLSIGYYAIELLVVFDLFLLRAMRGSCTYYYYWSRFIAKLKCLAHKLNLGWNKNHEKEMYSFAFFVICYESTTFYILLLQSGLVIRDLTIKEG